MRYPEVSITKVENGFIAREWGENRTSIFSDIAEVLAYASDYLKNSQAVDDTPRDVVSSSLQVGVTEKPVAKKRTVKNPVPQLDIATGKAVEEEPKVDIAVEANISVPEPIEAKEVSMEDFMASLQNTVRELTIKYHDVNKAKEAVKAAMGGIKSVDIKKDKYPSVIAKFNALIAE